LQSKALVTALWYRNHNLVVGVSHDPAGYVATGVGIVVVALVLGLLGRGGRLSYGGPLWAIGAGYLIFSWLESRLSLGLFGALVFLGGLGIYLAQPPHAYTVLIVGAGLAAIVLGLWNRFETRAAS
jgi:hypothetical protein